MSSDLLTRGLKSCRSLLTEYWPRRMFNDKVVSVLRHSKLIVLDRCELVSEDSFSYHYSYWK